MSINLMQTNVDIDDPNLSGLFTDLQGNIVKSHGRDYSRHVFVRFHDAERSRAWIRRLATRVTSALDQAAQTKAYKNDGDAQLFVGFLLSSLGYRALGFAEDQIPDDKAFLNGMKDLEAEYDTRPRGDHRPVKNPLLDEIDQWDEPFQGDLHALLILAFQDKDEASSVKRLDAEVEELRDELEGFGEVVVVQEGRVLRNERGQVIEHFGFVDGSSNPLFMRQDLKLARARGGFEHYDTSAYLGLIVVRDLLGGPTGHGSYFAYRKLQQNIKGFHRHCENLAAKLTEARKGFDTDVVTEVSPELAGAMAVGRFPDGTPVGEQQVPGWTSDPNDFNYDHDVTGRKAPLPSHCRKTNPRLDTMREFGAPPNVELSRRIVRRAISYGSPEMRPDEEWTDAGLLFFCAQSNIEHQFIFMQHSWCNNQVFLQEGTGLDPICGVAPKGEAIPQKWPARWGLPEKSFAGGDQSKDVEYLFHDVVRMRGGEYFFAPSLSFLRGV